MRLVNEWLSRGAVSCRIAEYLRMPAAYGSLERIPLLRSEDATEVSGKLGRIDCTDVQVKLGARTVQCEARSMYS